MDACVGKNVPRLDGVEKVTGATKYLDDMEIAGCWYGAVVRSEVPHGKIKKIVYDGSFDWSKVVCCTHEDIPGKNVTIFLFEDQPILAKEYLCHVGEAIVVVAAPTKELAADAKRHVRVEVEELPPVLSIEESRFLKQKIYGENNIISNYLIQKGDIEKGFADADFIVEGEYKTGFHEHAYIEPQGMAAIPRKDGGLTVVGSLQCPYYVLKTLKSALTIDETKVNVIQAPIGGAFGGKEDYPSLLGLYVALLSKKSGKPVKMVYGRDEDILVTTKRHPSVVRHKTGVKKDGTITAMDIDVAFNGGAYSTLSPVVLSRGVIHAAGPYKCPNVQARAICYATNNVPAGAFRGFGAPQTIFALESHLDLVAKKIGISPLALRLKNCAKIGDTLSTSQLLKESVAAEECLLKAVELSDFEKKWSRFDKKQNHPQPPFSKGGRGGIKKGIGLALYMHGGAFTGSGEAIMKTEAGLRLNPDGTASVLTGCTDMGQGAHTVLPQIAADTLGVDMKYVNCEVPDTSKVPDSGPTVASRTTMVIGNTIQKCAIKFKAEMEAFVNANPQLAGAPFNKVGKEYFKAKGELKIIERYTLPPGINWDPAKHLGDAYPAYSWACDVAEVTVDTETYEVSVDKMTIVVDPGKAVNPILLEGQMEGGTLQAIGWGLLENMVYKNGRPQNNRFQTYIIPTVKDAPKWKVAFVEKPFSHGPYGAKGIGELPLDGGAPAVANAIYNAIGVRIDDLPITPEKVFEALNEKKS